MGKNLPADARDSGKIPVSGKGRGGDPLEKKMATHSSILAWEIPQTEEPGELQSMGSQRVGHDLESNIRYTKVVRRLNPRSSYHKNFFFLFTFVLI